MEHNDVTVVIYRILSELYQSKKNGETAKEQTMTARRLGIPESYRSDVIKWLIGKGYIMKRWSPEGVERWYENGASFNLTGRNLISVTSFSLIKRRNS